MALVGLLLVSSAVSQQTLKGHVLTDKTAGFKITIPNNWVQLPINVSELRVLAWFHTKRRFRAQVNPGASSNAQHFSLRVIKLQRPWNGKGKKQRPQDYAAYLGRAFRTGTYKVTKTPGTHRSQPVVKWEVAIAVDGYDRAHVTTWVITRGKFDYAVQFYLLEDYLARQRPHMTQTFGSFRFIEANPAKISVATKQKPFALRHWLKLPLLERRRQRAELEAAHVKRMLDHLPPGWSSQESKYFLILSHSNPKTTRYVRDTVDAFGKWLRERLGPLSDMRPMRATIRLCKNSSEYYAYRRGGWRADYNFANREIVMCNDDGVLNMKDVLWAVYRRYMLDVAPEVFFNTPIWLRKSLYSYFSAARLKRHKLIFPYSQKDVSVFVRLQRARSVVHTAEELMAYDESEISDDRQDEGTGLIRFYEGSGKRCRPVGKFFLRDYMIEIQKLVRELDTDDEDILVWDDEETILELLEPKLPSGQKLSAPSLTSRWKSYFKIVGTRRKSFALALQKRACPWSKSQWAIVERAFRRFQATL